MTPWWMGFIQFLEGMSEKIKMGIEAAQTGLIKEKTQKEQEEVSKEIIGGWCRIRVLRTCLIIVYLSCNGALL